MGLVVYDQRGRKYPVKNGTAKTRFGKVKVDREGIITCDGKTFFACRASLQEDVEMFRMGGRPVYPYDAGIMLAMLGVRRGTRLLDAGTGSGAVAFLAWNWGADVVSYEKEKRFYEIAKENLSGTSVRLVNTDVTECSEEEAYDAVFLDLGEPERVIPHVKKCLKNGGLLGYFSPVVNENVHKIMEEEGFINVQGIVLDHQKLRLKKKVGIEPESLGFPGFFVWGRKAEGFRILKRSSA